MPQATDAARDEWDGPDDTTAIAYLETAGYRMTRGFQWRKPTPEHVPTPKEISAINFLIHEWDFGGIAG